MGMDPETGNIRALDKAEDLGEKEVLFTVGEETEIKGCLFEVLSIRPAPVNEIVLKGKMKTPPIQERPLDPERSPA